MKNARLLPLIGICLTIWTAVSAQDLNRKVSLHYEREQLGVVLDDISRDYDVRFHYSSDFVPIEHPVTLAVDNTALSVALDDLCTQAPVEYKSMSGYVVFKASANRQELSQLRRPLPKSVPQTSPIYPTKKAPPIQPRPKTPVPTPLHSKQMKQLPGGNDLAELDFDNYNFPIVEPEENDFLSDIDTRLAQISLMPFLSSNLQRGAELINNLSVNVLWGTNGGVDGFEVGGFVNNIINDVKGVQIAGLGNSVGGEMVGTQIGGLWNKTAEKTQGVQAAGLYNLSGETDAVQVAGLFNFSRGDFAGVQIAGLYNASKGKALGVQAAGLFNASRGKTKSQISGLFNVAGDVSWGQASSLLNVGKKVDGFQFGLINISDTISGAPIGLLNIVKKGYNRVEFSGSESLFANFALKLGARSFYNIFHVGARWDDATRIEDGEEVNGTFTSWGLGYGFGTAPTLGPRTILNLEAVAIHVNEMEPWTKELNLLGQFRILLDVRLGRRTSLFSGPVGNLMVSRRFDPETGSIGSKIPPKVLYDKTTNNTNVKMWVGFQAGIRF